MTVCAVILAVGAANTVLACNVPVFRYALERWQADSYEVTLYHRGSLPAAEQATASALRDAANQYAANFSFTDVDVSGPTNIPLPWLTAAFPAAPQDLTIAWQGPFTADTGRFLLDSPARRELVRRLVRGDSGVWVLLDGDDATTSLVATELRQQEQKIAVLNVDPEDPRTEANRDLKIAFSILPVSRDNPEEKFFVSTLLNSGLDPGMAKGPILFPVFGRGRLLAGFAGNSLNVAAIAEAAMYMCGPCSCEIKAQHPGVDLLLAADWETSVAERVVQNPPLPPLVSLSTLAAAAKPHAQAPAPVQVTNMGRNIVVALTAILAAVIAGTLFILRRRRT